MLERISTGNTAWVYRGEQECPLCIQQMPMNYVSSVVLSALQVLRHLNSHSNCTKHLTVTISMLQMRKSRSREVKYTHNSCPSPRACAVSDRARF
jgi:hypothetical protein